MGSTRSAAVHEEWYAALPRVSPRYLAGTLYGDATPGLQPLEQAGWLHLTDEKCTTRYFAPDGRRCVTFHPEQQELVAPGLHSLWRAWSRPCPHAPLTWAAQFTSDTPTEVIGAFTTALATDPGPEVDRPHTPRNIQPPDPGPALEPLTAAGWESANTLHQRGYTSPDGQAAAHYRRHAAVTDAQAELDRGAAWLIWAQADNEAPMAWRATFTAATPPHLIAAFLTALTDPTGLPRDPTAIPARLRTQLTITPTTS